MGYSGVETNAIIRQFLPRVRYYAGKYSHCLPPELSLDDLIIAGVIGLMEAVKRYDPKMNATMSTFVDFRIRGSVIDEIRSMLWGSKDARKRVDEVKHAYRELEIRNNRAVSDDEVADFMGMSLDELHKILASSSTMNVLSLEDMGLSQKGEQLNILDVISRSDDVDILEEMNLKEIKETLASAIDKLNEKERLVITLYYYEELTMKEISSVLDVSESRVCQLHGSALMKLRSKVRAYE